MPTSTTDSKNEIRRTKTTPQPGLAFSQLSSSFVQLADSKGWVRRQPESEGDVYDNGLPLAVDKLMAAMICTATFSYPVSGRSGRMHNPGLRNGEDNT